MSQISRQVGLLSTLIFVASSIAATSLHAQTRNHRLGSDDLATKGLIVDGPMGATQQNDIVLASRAITALKQLQAKIIVYRSLHDFEADSRLGHVSLDTFKAHLHTVSIELEPIIAQLSDPRLRAHLTNALYSFRDGAFWWEKVVQPRVVTTRTVELTLRSVTPAETFFITTVPYTVAIYWRQAAKFLLQAETLVTPKAVRNF
ncbi:MAG TPA: hypothetical protein VGQ72_08620 [Pyrinomonadaceae bacterium]|jgi:hypothetical protein|nr:hypothetical protein [Pyrinomonadaceae bacterium]